MNINYIILFPSKRLYVATSRQLQRLESISRSPIYSHFFETINGASTIRAFDAQQRFISLNDVNVDENSMVKYPVILIHRYIFIDLRQQRNPRGGGGGRKVKAPPWGGVKISSCCNLCVHSIISVIMNNQETIRAVTGAFTGGGGVYIHFFAFWSTNFF